MTLVVISFYQGAVGSLPDTKLAVVVGRPVQSLLTHGSQLRELSHVVTEQLLSSNVNTESLGKVCVVASSVLRVGIVFPAFYRSVDNHRGHSESRNQIGGDVVIIRNPGTVQHLQHAGLRRLGGHKEPHGGGKVKPGGGH